MCQWHDTCAIKQVWVGKRVLLVSFALPLHCVATIRNEHGIAPSQIKRWKAFMLHVQPSQHTSCIVKYIFSPCADRPFHAAPKQIHHQASTISATASLLHTAQQYVHALKITIICEFTMSCVICGTFLFVSFMCLPMQLCMCYHVWWMEILVYLVHPHVIHVWVWVLSVLQTGSMCHICVTRYGKLANSNA